MALIKETTFKGFAVNYWKITRVVQDMAQLKTEVKISLYKDINARTADINNILENKYYVLDGVDKTRTEIYAELKLLPDFDGATDY